MRKGIVLLIMIICDVFFSQIYLLSQSSLNFRLNGSYRSIKGKYTGEYYLSGSDTRTGTSIEFLLPKLANSLGYGISLGVTGTDYSGIQYYSGFTYTRVQYDASFLGEDIGKAVQNIYGLTMKFLFPKSSESSIKNPVVQGYIPLGMEYGTLKVKDGLLDASYSSLGDAIYSHFGFPIGGGIIINPFKAFSIDIGLAYRIAFTSKVRKAGDKKNEYDAPSKVGMGGINFEVGFSYNFYSK